MTLSTLVLSACADTPMLHGPAQLVGLATTPKEGADFVRATRPEKTEFTSVGIETAHQAEKPRDATGVKQLQAELEAQRDAGHAILHNLAPQPAAPAPPQTQQTKQDETKAKVAAKPKPKPKPEAPAKPKDQTSGEAQTPQ
jgi:outer membrane biosynthesis protein TonB